MAADQAEFEQLLILLISADNATRIKAEETYNNLAIEIKVSQLLNAILNAAISEDARSTSAVLLRRLFSAEFYDFYSPLPPESQAQFKAQILHSLQQDVTPALRRKICEVVAEVARNFIDEDGENHWPEFLQFLFQCANSDNVSLQESALRIFATVPTIFGTKENQYMDVIKQMLQKSLNPEVPVEVQHQSVRAIGAFILAHDKDANIHKHFADLLPVMLAIIAHSITQQDNQTLLKLLIELAETSPKFLRSQIEQVFEVCLNTYRNTEFEDSWRTLAIEAMVSLAENAAPLVRKRCQQYIVALIPLCLQMMTDLEDDEGWSTSEDISEEDNSDNNVVAESSLDRLACSLGGKMVLPHIISTIPTMLSNSDWKQRHAALMAISAIGEGCHKQMEAMLDEIMSGILNFLHDSHPRVRHAACNAIGQMSTDFAPVFEKKFHDRVVPGLLSLLDDVQNPRVQAHAGAALVNFSEDCPKSILTRYLDAIMTKLQNILNVKFDELVKQGTKLVLEQVVTTIASVADTTGEDFTPYFDRFMPCLKFIIQNAHSEDLRMLRGKTIECISLIGLAVGQEVFMPHASEVMDMLLKTHTEKDADDDPQTSYLISAWARMCKILGKQFEQYLPLVMAPVMRTAAMKPEVALLDNDEVEDIEFDMGWSFITLGEQQNFAIKTAGMEDKAAACEMLVCYARELKDGFVNYAEEVVRLMVPMLKFYFHDGVREAAAESLPYLLDCAKIKGPQYLEGMWNYICPELLRAIDTEPESTVITELLHALAKCIETLGPQCLSQESMDDVLRLISKSLKEHFTKSETRAQARKEEDYDDDVEEQLQASDHADVHILSKIADVLHALFLTYKENFIPYFDQVVEMVIQLLSPDRPWADRQWGLCIIDDVIEYTGPASVKYQQFFIQPITQYVVDSSPDVRQAAAYGCGVLGQFGGETFAVACAQLIPRLVEMINAPGSRDHANANATENAISAVTKILKHNASAISNPDEILSIWFNWLPVVEDDVEAPFVYGYFSDLIQANHPVILGPENANLPRIVTIIAEAFYRDVIEAKSVEGARMVGIIKQINSNAEMMQACVSVLSATQREALEEACREVPA